MTGQYNNMASFRDLTEEQLNRILQEADHRCYREIASEMHVPIGTVKRIVRTYTRQIRKKVGRREL